MKKRLIVLIAAYIAGFAILFMDMMVWRPG
jgi:hypothetical protein